jgi:hypothetical protein
MKGGGGVQPTVLLEAVFSPCPLSREAAGNLSMLVCVRVLHWRESSAALPGGRRPAATVRNGACSVPAVGARAAARVRSADRVRAYYIYIYIRLSSQLPSP